MARIIKLSEVHLGNVVAYERSSLQAMGPEYVGDDGFVDPVIVLEEARAAAEEKVQQAYAEGLRRGMQAGLEQFNESVGQAAEMLQQAATSMEEARTVYLKDLESNLLRLASAIVSRILSREVQVSPEVVKDMTLAALERVMDQEKVTLRVNPHDLEAIREHKVHLLAQFDVIRQLEVLPDEAVAPGGCIAETAELSIDAQLESQLESLINQMME